MTVESFHSNQNLTVAEVIEKLKEMPPDLPVITEGCDCDGATVSVIRIKNEHEDYVYLSRQHESVWKHD